MMASTKNTIRTGNKSGAPLDTARPEEIVTTKAEATALAELVRLLARAHVRAMVDDLTKKKVHTG